MTAGAHSLVGRIAPGLLSELSEGAMVQVTNVLKAANKTDKNGMEKITRDAVRNLWSALPHEPPKMS